jgi:hypothetical protein
MKAAQRETPMVARATVPRIGEQNVFVLVTANPLTAALCLREVLHLAAQATAGFDGFCFEWLAHLTLRSGLKMTSPVKRRHLAEFAGQHWRERLFLKLHSCRCMTGDSR